MPYNPEGTHSPMRPEKNAPPSLRIFRSEDTKVAEPETPVRMLLIEEGAPWEFRSGFVVGVAVGLMLAGYVLS